MQYESVKYKKKIMHNIDTWMWNTVLVYIKDILKGELEGDPPFVLHPAKYENIPHSWKKSIFPLLYRLFIWKIASHFQKLYYFAELPFNLKTGGHLWYIVL